LADLVSVGFIGKYQFLHNGNNLDEEKNSKLNFNLLDLI